MRFGEDLLSKSPTNRGSANYHLKNCQFGTYGDKLVSEIFEHTQNISA